VKLPRSEEIIEMKLGVLVPVAMALGITLAAAQNPIKRTDLQQVDQPEGYTTSMMIVEIAPNHSVPPHFHPGPELSYILEGEMTITFPGKPPVTLKRGDSLTFPANAVHQGTMGPAGVKLLNTYVIPKGKPITSPASQ
jgi:quercetin dioxygenase-like cupin family protein